MVLEIEFPRLQSGVAFWDELPVQLGEPVLQLEQQFFRACACAQQQALGGVLAKALVQHFGQLVEGSNGAEQEFPSVAIAFGDGDAYFVGAGVNC